MWNDRSRKPAWDEPRVLYTDPAAFLRDFHAAMDLGRVRPAPHQRDHLLTEAAAFREARRLRVNKVRASRKYVGQWVAHVTDDSGELVRVIASLTISPVDGRLVACYFAFYEDRNFGPG